VCGIDQAQVKRTVIHNIIFFTQSNHAKLWNHQGDGPSSTHTTASTIAATASSAIIGLIQSPRHSTVSAWPPIVRTGEEEARDAVKTLDESLRAGAVFIEHLPGEMEAPTFPDEPEI
jgi:hypothetical protein